MLGHRRDRRPDRYSPFRIALIFLAAGVWIGGVVSGRESVTAVAIVILLVALVLQVLGRRERG